MGISADVTGAASAALGIIAIVLMAYLAALGLGIALYILRALGLYTIAQRRGIRHPWMAWLPLTDMWILGSISDQYRYVVKGQIRNRRKVLLGFCIGLLVLGIGFFCAYVVLLTKLLMSAPQIMQIAPQQMMGASTGSLLLAAGVCLVAWGLGIVIAVFRYVCLYDLYASCNPDNKVLFLVLSILFNVTLPFFVFACRKKDGGMPPRRDEMPSVRTTEPEVFCDE